MYSHAAYMRIWYAKNREAVNARRRARYLAGHPPRDVLYGAERMRAFRSKRREITNAAKDVPCADCGGHFPPECMDFDHVRGDKAFNLSRGWGLSVSAILEEIAKCDVVCANCHRTRTKVRRALLLVGEQHVV